VYAKLAAELRAAIQALMHDRDDTGVWFDYDLGKQAIRKRGFFPSNVFPLALIDQLYPAGKEERARQCGRAIAYLGKEDILGFKGTFFCGFKEWNFLYVIR
jgi:neutral trehalase